MCTNSAILFIFFTCIFQSRDHFRVFQEVVPLVPCFAKNSTLHALFPIKIPSCQQFFFSFARIWLSFPLIYFCLGNFFFFFSNKISFLIFVFMLGIISLNSILFLPFFSLVALPFQFYQTIFCRSLCITILGL